MTAQRQSMNVVRRKLLKAAVAGAGALALGHIPYDKPAVKSFFGVRSAWAQASVPLPIVIAGQLGTVLPIGSLDPNAGQDRWAVPVLMPNTTLSFVAVPDANLNPEIYLYAPGAVGLGQPNLFTGNPFGLDAAGLTASESATVTVVNAGTYVFAIEDARPSVSEQSGLYTVTINADNPLGTVTLIVDEGPESDANSPSDTRSAQRRQL